MADHDLTGDFTARVMVPAGLGFIEGKYAVDDRPDLMLFHYPAHVLETTTAAGCHWLERRLTQEHGHEVDATLRARQRYPAAIGTTLIEYSITLGPNRGSDS
jgi:hypothetical protein